MAIRFDEQNQNCELMTNGSLLRRDNLDGFDSSAETFIVWYDMEVAEKFTQGKSLSLFGISSQYVYKLQWLSG